MRHRAMKRILISLLLLFAAAALAGAVDFGGMISNETALVADPAVGVDQRNVVSVWFNTGTHNKIVFHAAGSYTFTLDRPYLFNLDDFRLKGTFPREGLSPSVFSFQFGRYMTSDFTEVVLDHTLDGFTLGFTFPWVRLDAAFGFTGLVLKPVSTVTMTKIDYAEQSIAGVWTGPKRLVGKVEARFPGLFNRHELNLSFILQDDLRHLFENAGTSAARQLVREGETTFSANRGGLLDSQYMLLGMSGPIITNLYYDVYGGITTGRTLSYISGAYEYAPIFGVLAAGEVRYYNEEFLFTRASFEFIFSSGDADSQSYVEGNTGGLATTFTPITPSSRGVAFSPALGNIFYPKLTFSMKPLSSLESAALRSFQTKLDVYVFFRSTGAPISESGIDPSSAAQYLGTEIDAAFRMRPFSDLGAALSFGFFLPSPAAFVSAKRGLWFTGKLAAFLSW